MRMRISAGRESSGGVTGMVGIVRGVSGVGKRWKGLPEGMKNERGERDNACIEKLLS